MKCINCNKRISSEVTFCPYCGVSINQEFSIDYFKTYIGNNYDILTTKSFSWNSLFFGFIYFFYRKMWVLGIIELLSLFIFYFYLGNYTYLIIFFMNLFIAFNFNSWYLEDCRLKVNLIKDQELDNNKIMELCKKKGGVTKTPIIILLIIIMGVTSFYFVKGVKNIITSVVNENIIRRSTI